MSFDTTGGELIQLRVQLLTNLASACNEELNRHASMPIKPYRKVKIIYACRNAGSAIW